MDFAARKMWCWFTITLDYERLVYTLVNTMHEENAQRVDVETVKAVAELGAAGAFTIC